MSHRFCQVFWNSNRDLWAKFLKRLKANSPYPEITGLLCALGSVFCTYVLVKWNTIPVYDYYINAEYYCPDSIKKNLQTSVALFVDPDGLLNSYSNKSEGKESFIISVVDSTISLFPADKAKRNAYTHYDHKAAKVVSEKLKYYTDGLFDDTIQSFLWQADDPDRLFFMHLYSCAEQGNIFIKTDTNVIYYVKDDMVLVRNEGYDITIIDRKIDSIFHSHEWKPTFLSNEHVYSHYSVLTLSNNSNPLTNRIDVEMRRKTYRKNRLQTFLMPKDISRAYYRISFVSWTIPTLDMRIKFNQDVVFESLPNEYQVGVNSLEIRNKKSSSIHEFDNVKLYAEFPDGENAQTVRTFFMALIITGLLKEFLKALYRTYKKYTNRIIS